jgi:AcrR family transcriptional regulator
MPTTVRPGLRERKRIATSRAIQLAALTLVTERGLDKVTIDDIATTADVSPRTFFNYFASKEAAIVGDGPGLPDPERQRAFTHAGAGRDVLSDLGELIAASAEHTTTDPVALRLRKGLHRQYPQLSSLLMSGRREMETQLVNIVKERLVADDPALQVDDPEVESRARLLTFVAVGAMRHAWMCWADAGGTEPLADRVRQSFADLQALRLSAERE